MAPYLRIPWTPRRALLAVALLISAAGISAARAIDIPWNYAVQVTASVDANQGQVTLRWQPPAEQSSNGQTNPQHTVYRKTVGDLNTVDWGTGTPVPQGQNSFVDSITPGVAYEYRITRTYPAGNAQFDGVGYVRTGISVPLVDRRGTVLLVVDANVANELTVELDQYVRDLWGDGWRVVRVDGFSATSNPSDLRNRIRDEYNRGGDVQAVLLFGHLPIVLSGTLTNPDGHHARPMPADGYYGDIFGDWGSGSFDGQHWVFARNTFPERVLLQVGRVDFADLPAIYAVSPFSSEIGLLRNYLAKNHAFRFAQRVPQRRALIGDAFGEYYFDGVVEPFAADAYRNFAPLFGDQIAVYDNFHGGSNTANWLGALADGSYLWAYGGGAGGDSGDTVASLGPNGVNSTDLISRNAKADFYLLFGSFMVDWSRPNNLLRSTLAPADYGLASVWAGRPFLYFHSMGLGETIGYGFRLSENLSGSLYDTPVKSRPSGNVYMQGVHLALLGDPTLRLDPVPPVAAFASDASGSARWSAPGGVNVQEYRVYRQTSDAGDFELEATLPAGTRSYAPSGTGTHMIRAVVLQTGSGTYYNASEGILWTVGTVNPGTPPPPAPPPPPEPDPIPYVPPPHVSTVNGLINLSSRLRLANDSNGATAGFVVSGSVPVKVLVRAVGPGLSDFGVGSPVPDPRLRLLDQQRHEVARNTGWHNDGNIAAAAAAVGAFALKSGSADAALLQDLAPGAYTAQVQAGRAGTVLVEVYTLATDANGSAAPLINLSTRGLVGPGADALVGGFVISGSEPRRVLIRAAGPALGEFGVAGTLADPVLTLRNGEGAALAHNDNWENGEKTDVVVGPTWGDVVAANTSAGAFPLPNGSKDAALVVQLRPGSYTATVDGANGSSGVALLEVYELR